MAARVARRGGNDLLQGIGVPWFDGRDRDRSVSFSLNVEDVTVEEGPEDDDDARTACVRNGFFEA